MSLASPVRPPSVVRRLFTLALCAAAPAWAGPVEDIDAAATKGPSETTPLRRGLTMLSGSGGNVTLLVSPGGTLWVDAPVATRADFQAYRTMLATVRERVAKLRAAGLTLAQVVERRPTAEFDDVWGEAVISPAFFTELVFTTLR